MHTQAANRRPSVGTAPSVSSWARGLQGQVGPRWAPDEGDGRGRQLGVEAVHLAVDRRHQAARREWLGRPVQRVRQRVCAFARHTPAGPLGVVLRGDVQVGAAAGPPRRRPVRCQSGGTGRGRPRPCRGWRRCSLPPRIGLPRGQPLAMRRGATPPACLPTPLPRGWRPASGLRRPRSP